MVNYIDNLLADPKNRIAIVSGEGVCGTAEIYTGRRSRLAITRRINKEAHHGDRFAYAVIETNDPGACVGYSVIFGGGNDADLGQTIFPDIDA